ncbi:hypothetical protein [Haloarcula brevis]|uniref:hypothetical protein n=1 Tax=Haloarcula brevis TaxID=3111453 RepID=UPI00300F6A31
MNRVSTPDETDPMEALAALREESHTGADRCWPCTVLNLGLVGVVVLFLRARERPLSSLLVALVGVAAIYLRGYVVPYTPEFAPRLVAASPVPDEWFHGESSRGTEAGDTPDEGESLADGTEMDGETVLRKLVAAGVIEAEGDQLFLAAAVDTAWYERMDDLAAQPLDSLAATLQDSLDGVDHAEPYADDDGTEWVAVGADSKRLLARPVVVAELAAYEVLGQRVDDERLRVAGAEAFRMFLDSCPVCGSDLVESSSVSCCGGHLGPRQNPDETLVCPTCEQRLYTFESDG